MNKNSAIFFDLDGTLIDEQIAMQALETRVGILLKSSAPKDYNFSADLLQTEETNIPSLGYGLASYTWSFAQTVQRALPSEETLQEVVSEFGAFLREFFNGNIQIVSGALEAIQALKLLGCGIHVISRGIEIEQKHKITSTGLHNFVDSITVVQGAKGGSIQKIIKEYSLDPNFCCMVGDSLKGDILPAMEVGIKAILVQPPNHWGHDRHNLELPISNPNFKKAESFADVPLLVRQLLTFI